LFYQLTFGQLGGRRSFEFLNVPSDTRIASMGGIHVSLSDWDPNMIFSNPASLNPDMYGHVSFNHAFYYANINISRLVYSHTFERTGSWGLGIQNVNYGKINGFDPSGNPIGEFSANELVVLAGNARRIGNFSLGVNAKIAYSSISGYHASSFLFDFGGIYFHPTEDLKVGLNIKNIGFLLSNYTPSSDTYLPFDVQVGVSYKPQNMPLRFSLTAYNLYKANLLYDNPDGDLQQDDPSTFSKIASHFNFGAEIILTKNINLRAGYNYLIRRELKLEQKTGGAGLSFGMMVKVSYFEFSYSRATYHVAGGINYIGITSNLSSFYRKSMVEIND